MLFGDNVEQSCKHNGRVITPQLLSSIPSGDRTLRPSFSLATYSGLNSAFSLFPFSNGARTPFSSPSTHAAGSAGDEAGAASSQSHRLVKCINCDYVTNDLHVLMEHLDTHYPVKTFLCVYCYQSFPGCLELNHHLQFRQCPFMTK